MEPNEQEKIEKLKESLYSKQNSPEIDPDKRTELPEHKPEVGDDWRQEVRKVGDAGKPRRILGWGKYLLYAAIGFMVVALGVSAFFFFGGLNLISSDNVEISIVGPVSVGAGEELSYEFIVTNNNKSRLENVNVAVNYPPGSRVAGDLEAALTRTNQSLRDIAPGETVRTSMKGVIFGEKGSEQILNFLLQYNLPDSNGVFEKAAEYSFIIESAPLIMQIERPANIYSNQEIELVVKLQANSNTPLENILVRADYPFGFTNLSSTPDNFADDANLWLFEKLEPREEVEIKIRGRIEGGENDERTIRFTAGTQSSENHESISATFVSQSESIVLKKPLIDLQLVWGSGGDDGVGRMGDQVQGNVAWKNNSGDTLRDVEITLDMVSDVLNEQLVSVQSGGFYQSNKDRITWNRNTTPVLREVQSGASGSLGFRFATVSPSSSLYFSKRNPGIDITMQSTGEQQNNNTFFAESSTAFSILSDVFLTTELLHESGPYPPKVEQKTVYKVHWEVKNSFNSLQNSEVRMVLPAYIEWIGAVSQGNENVTFNPTTREVVWNMGNVKAGAGFAGSSRNAYFNIGLIPSANQSNSKPVTLGSTTLTATDSFAIKPITVDLRERNNDADNQVADGRVKQ